MSAVIIVEIIITIVKIKIKVCVYRLIDTAKTSMNVINQNMWNFLMNTLLNMVNSSRNLTLKEVKLHSLNFILLTDTGSQSTSLKKSNLDNIKD